ncbi:tetratricopeptide repeat protein [Paenibacillus riograndensis]|uniref:Tetratricopeptide repeat-containing protein n=1 Tax=Paenibacillus riograndensis SBR5 TaxID=1073571 RepID=A0A0E4HDK9_9BACL|nr:tetratricopeptide repeat protein [Paenibacillus riograndensis]CQR58371.1 tetratricopeptide repeat-containing protein [Paenibacillus riograndensis SBR5]
MTDSGPIRYRFSEAPIWELQRKYYEELGMQAWKNDQVPQYITSNPMIGTSYAEMIFGFLQDRAGMGHTTEPVIILELGAGAGRLAFHVLQKLCELVDYAGLPLPPFTYVMSDLPWKNITGWQQHPGLIPFVEQGILDFARFDAVADTELHLIESGRVITPGMLAQPLMVIANYFFDSIPQELLYVDEGKIYECEVSLQYPEQSDTMGPSEVLRDLIPEYHYRRAAGYEEKFYPYREVIAFYQEKLEDSHVLFPAAALECMERLSALSGSGFLLLTADKGDHRLENWEFAEPPKLIHHGSISLTANYHALVCYFEQKGALASFTEHHYKNLNVGCIFMLEEPLRHVQARLAYRRFIERFGPDDFFSLKLWIDQNYDTIGLQQILGFWRLGGYDAELFIQSAERISGLLEDASDEEILDLKLGIDRMWTGFYPMPQKYDLALDSGLLLFEMGLYEDSRRFLTQSLRETEDEPVVTVLYCLAICSYELEDLEAALEYTRQALVLEPEHEEALDLLAALSGD